MSIAAFHAWFVVTPGLAGAAEPLLAHDTVLLGRADDAFARAFVGVGDLDGDGFDDVAVSAYLTEVSGEDVGAIHLYRGSATGLAPLPDVTLYGDQPRAMFGLDLAPAGDVNSDGRPDLIAAAYQYDNPEGTLGAAFVWHGATGALVEPTPVRLHSDGNLGAVVAVAGAGDVDGDGFADVVFSAPSWNLLGELGMVQGYYGSGAGVDSSHDLRLLGGVDRGEFGTTIAGIGDVDGDGFDELAVGEPYHVNPEVNEGAVHVFFGGVGGLRATDTQVADSDNAQTLLGGGTHALAGADVNGDGFSDLIAGAYSWESPALTREQGATHVFHGSAGGLSAVANLILVGPAIVSARFGWSVAALGDLNADGFDEIAVGAPGTDEAYVYVGSAAGLVPLAVQVMPAAGSMVASLGDVDGNGVPDLGVGNPLLDLEGVDIWLGVTCALPVVVHPDLDGDGFGDVATPVTLCDVPVLPGWTADGTDCDDADADVSPSQVESCGNQTDDDCDGVVDVDSPDAYPTYADADGDGYGDPATELVGCDSPEDRIEIGGDCDDHDVRFNPAQTALEACDDPADYDCDGAVPYVDGDRDGHAACTECDDSDAAVFPTALEVCNGVDDDCDGTIDAEDDDIQRCAADDTGENRDRDRDRDGCGCAHGANPIGWNVALVAPVVLSLRRAARRGSSSRSPRSSPQ